MNKFRAGKIKQEHQIIPGVRPILEQIEQCTLVQAIFTGKINPLNSRPDLTFQYFTDSGLKLLAKNGSAIQEIFVTTADKEAVKGWLEEQGLIEKPEPPPKAVKPGAPGPYKTVTLPYDSPCSQCGNLMKEGSRVVQLGSKRYYYAHVRCVR